MFRSCALLYEDILYRPLSQLFHALQRTTCPPNLWPDSARLAYHFSLLTRKQQADCNDPLTSGAKPRYIFFVQPSICTTLAYHGAAFLLSVTCPDSCHEMFNFASTHKTPRQHLSAMQSHTSISAARHYQEVRRIDTGRVKIVDLAKLQST